MNIKDIIQYTSCYANAKTGNLVSITGDGGNAWGFYGPAYKKLAPSLKLYEYWRDNPDNLKDEDLIEYYIREYYNHRLNNIDVYELFNTLYQRFGEKIILLCHELPSNSLIMSKEHFCHRNVLADFIYLKIGLIIPEISIKEDGKIIYHKRPDYKPLIKKYMK